MKSILALTSLLLFSTGVGASCPEAFDTELRKLHSNETLNICEAFPGKPLLIINTASHCGFTDQFSGLEALHQKYTDKGLVVIGFPSNDFRQESKDEAKTANVCFVNYGVTFAMTEPIAVTGNGAHPIFKYLIEKAGEPGWNFYKYIVSADGSRVERLPSRVKPDSLQMEKALEAVL